MLSGFGGATPNGVQVVTPSPASSMLAITIPAGAAPGTNLTVMNPNGGM